METFRQIILTICTASLTLSYHSLLTTFKIQHFSSYTMHLQGAGGVRGEIIWPCTKKNKKKTTPKKRRQHDHSRTSFPFGSSLFLVELHDPCFNTLLTTLSPGSASTASSRHQNLRNLRGLLYLLWWRFSFRTRMGKPIFLPVNNNCIEKTNTHIGDECALPGILSSQVDPLFAGLVGRVEVW